MPKPLSTTEDWRKVRQGAEQSWQQFGDALSWPPPAGLLGALPPQDQPGPAPVGVQGPPPAPIGVAPAPGPGPSGQFDLSAVTGAAGGSAPVSPQQAQAMRGAAPAPAPAPAADPRLALLQQAANQSQPPPDPTAWQGYTNTGYGSRATPSLGPDVDTTILQMQGAGPAPAAAAGRAPSSFPLQPRPGFTDALEQLARYRFGDPSGRSFGDQADMDEFKRGMISSPREMAMEYARLEHTYGPDAARAAMEGQQAARSQLLGFLGGERGLERGYHDTGTQRFDVLNQGMNRDATSRNQSRLTDIAEQKMKFDQSPGGILLEGAKEGMRKTGLNLSDDRAVQAAKEGAQRLVGVGGGPVPGVGVQGGPGPAQAAPATGPQDSAALKLSKLIDPGIMAKLDASGVDEKGNPTANSYKAKFDILRQALGDQFIQNNQDLVREYLAGHGASREAVGKDYGPGFMSDLLINAPAVAGQGLGRLLGGGAPIADPGFSMSQGMRRILNPREAQSVQALRQLYSGK